MLGFSSAAFAEDMQVVVVRSTENGCEPLCTEWISAQGEITGKTDDAFRAMFKKLGKRRLPVVITSPGGDVDAAIAIGRMIRERRIDVVVGRTEFRGCHPRDKKCTFNEGRGADYFGTATTSWAFCNSACPLVLAGGQHRIARESARIGVHQVTRTEIETRTTYKTEYRIVNGKRKESRKAINRKVIASRTIPEMGSRIEKQLRSYLKSMGVDPQLVDRMKQTKASDISYLSMEERASTKLTDGTTPIFVILNSNACKGFPASSHCRLITTDDV